MKVQEVNMRKAIIYKSKCTTANGYVREIWSKIDTGGYVSEAVEVTFHQFAYDEGEGGRVHPVAICELENGELVTTTIGNIRFVK